MNVLLIAIVIIVVVIIAIPLLILYGLATVDAFINDEPLHYNETKHD